MPGPAFGLDSDGYFGPLPQHNAPVQPNRWTTFYAQRRLLPNLRLATDSGSPAASLAGGIERIARRLPALAGPEPHPVLLPGDAQQHNLASTPDGPVLVDAAPYFGHPLLTTGRQILAGHRVNGAWQSMTVLHGWVAFMSLDAWILESHYWYRPTKTKGREPWRA